MNAISYPFLVQYEAAADPKSDAGAELAHHAFDLRAHAAIMLFNAALAIYCGARIVGFDNPLGAGTPARIEMAPGALSICAAMIFIGIAGLCVLGAYGFWRKTAGKHRP